MAINYIPPPLNNLKDVEQELGRLGSILNTQEPLVVPVVNTRPTRTIEGSLLIIPEDNGWIPEMDAGLYIVLHNVYRRILE